MEGTEELEYVGFWPRLAASLIDAVLLLAIQFPLIFALYGSDYWAEDAPFIHGPIDFLLTWIVPPAIYIAFWTLKGATPGKMAIGARVADARTGQNITIMQGIIRYIGYFVSAIVFCLGYLWIAFDAKKRGWHDYMAGTVVVRAKNRNVPVKFEQAADQARS